MQIWWNTFPIGMICMFRSRFGYSLRLMKFKTKVIDLFCGIGGLSYGLSQEKLNVVTGIDNDEACRFGYERNNQGRFICKDIFDVMPRDIEEWFGFDSNTVKILVGCAPCQPFSKLNLSSKNMKDQMQPLDKFADLVRKAMPQIVSMENVSSLCDTEKYPVFKNFLGTLKKAGYRVHYEIINAAEYGVPQNRKRVILLASLMGDIRLIEKTHMRKQVTVRDSIGDLAEIVAGETCSRDSLHRARRLSDLNLKRIRSTPRDGGNSEAWSKDLMLKCHIKESGRTYKRSVYGRMYWDKPAPTITTQCVGLGNGRFGHPQQDRAISLREAARLQTFPDGYELVDPNQPVYTKTVAKFIGNAVPIRLASVIGASIKKHLEDNHVN